jgi:hypothetical protein
MAMLKESTIVSNKLYPLLAQHLSSSTQRGAAPQAATNILDNNDFWKPSSSSTAWPSRSSEWPPQSGYEPSEQLGILELSSKVWQMTFQRKDALPKATSILCFGKCKGEIVLCDLDWPSIALTIWP